MNGATQTNMLVQLIPFVVIFAIFYLLIILPARKKQKQHQNLIASLKGGERVITSGGVYGTVSRVMDDRLQIAKGSISGVVDATGDKGR
jgi:preprotein translocase subunit YajC